MAQEEIRRLFDKWCQKLRIVPSWDVKLKIVSDPSLSKSGDIKIDCTDRNAIVILNTAGPKFENPEEVLVHELLHLKLYPMDQVTESLITSNFEDGSPASNFAYTQFFTALEGTVEELTKCFLLEFGENKDLTFRRCDGRRSYNELFDGLKNL